MHQKYPIIIIGAHRSGTTMLSCALEKLGIFMGSTRDENNEAFFFQRLNRWMFRSVHAHWDYPLPFLEVLADHGLREKYVQYLKLMVRSPRFLSYSGLKNYRRCGLVPGNDIPWGFKDPRTTFTLPVWLDVFGGGHVILVRRHGVDVAASLVARNTVSRKTGFSQFERIRRYSLIYPLYPKKGGFLNSVRCQTLQGAFDIWYEYMLRAESVLQKASVPVLDLCYEHILAQPETELKKITRFCRLDRLDAKIPAVAAAFDRNRAFAYMQKPDMHQCALNNNQHLLRFGYSADGFGA